MDLWVFLFVINAFTNALGLIEPFTTPRQGLKLTNEVTIQPRPASVLACALECVERGRHLCEGFSRDGCTLGKIEEDPGSEGSFFFLVDALPEGYKNPDTPPEAEVQCLGQSHCCGEMKQCAVMEGTCNSDEDCQEGLVCGQDNCSGPTFEDDDDCCFDPANKSACLGGYWCCTNDYPCGLGEGECYVDSNCKENYVCGRNNCEGPTFEPEDDCCHDPSHPPDKCLGGNGCCSSYHPCGANEGVCYHDSHCGEGLLCGMDNCVGDSFNSGEDCCFDPLNPLPCLGGEDCCNPARPCGVNEGDCDVDDDCKVGLSCGQDNCQGSTFTTENDCCYDPSNPPECAFGDDCCSYNPNLCGIGQGDCDSDDECREGLQCGEDNCLLPDLGSKDCCFDPANMPKCYGGTWCCDSESPTHPCGQGEGNCDTDENCAPGLVCGQDNCDMAKGTFENTDNCCEDPLNRLACTGGKDCCSDQRSCGLGEGDCDLDSECTGNLICLEDNCNMTTGSFEISDDCCNDPENPLPCVGGEWCCTVDRPCNIGEGNCDADSQCLPGLVCGIDNCGGPHFDGYDNCCFDPASPLACSGGHDCCRMDRYLCGIGEGDCDSDTDCADSLSCGTDNCVGPYFDSSDDCCTDVQL